MHYINITVRNKVAVNPAQDRYVCGNSDYIVRFDFDAEWDAFETKTARFIKEDGTYVDQVFSGNDCPVPVIADTYKLQVGVFAGNLSTTTAAYVPCKKSILCGGGVPAAPAEDVYNQIMEKLNSVPSMTGEPHMQLVSDADGKAVWEERLAYKHVQSDIVTLFAEEALMDNPEDPNVYFSATPLTAIPEVGKTYEVTINGTKYSTTAHPVEEDGAQIAVQLGNPVFSGLEATEELYGIVIPLPEHQAVMGGMSIIFLSDLDADSITLSIKGQATITTIKKIDPEYIPDTHKTITLTIDSDGNVTSDTTFEETIKLDNAQLQAAIKVVQAGSYGGQSSIMESDVQVRRRSVEGMGVMLEITFRQFADPGDYPAAKEVTRYIYWSSQGLQFPAFKLYSLPVMDAGWGMDRQTYYLRCVGGVWQPATIDQLKADLGLT